MFVHGCDCSIAFKTSHCVMGIPFVSETLREDVTMLYEEASIEGDGTVKAMRKSRGAVGCVVTSLTMNTTPFLFCLAFGFRENPVFVSETRNLYRQCLRLVSVEDSSSFDVIQERGIKSNEERLFEECRVSSFEVRIERVQSIKMKMDIISKRSPGVYSYDVEIHREHGERFYGDYVTYKIKDTSTGSVSEGNKNIYGVTIVCKKDNGIKTEVWIRRVLENGSDIPNNIDEMVITARLLRDTYEHYGTFSITLKNLLLISDETNIESADAVLGQLRYFVNGSVSAETFSSGENSI